MNLILPKSVVAEREAKREQERAPDITIDQIHPRDDLLLVEMCESAFEHNGVVLPEDSETAKPEVALVLAVGQGRWSKDGSKRLPNVCRVGDLVLVSKYVGKKVALVPGKYFHFVKEDEVLGTCGHVERKVKGEKLPEVKAI